MAQVRQDNVQIKLEIDGAQSKTELDNLTRKAQVLQQGLKEMKRGSEEYIAANKELREVNKRMEELRTDIGLTGLSTNQLGKLAKQLGRELKDLVPDTAAYVVKSQELAKVENRITELRTGLDQVRASLDNSGSGFSGFVKKAATFAGIQLGIEAVISSLKEFGKEAINSAVQGSDSISDMEKSLNVTTAEAKALREQLQGIDTRTSQENLEGIAVAAGQLGIAKDQAVAFTQSVDQAVVALGDEFTGGVEEVAKSLGGLQKLFKETKDVSPADAITKIGSAVNALGADGTATGPVIADFTARIGQLGDLAPQITQTLGLGAAFQELGLSAEISAGGLSNILITAAKDTAGFGKQIGLTSQQFEHLINTDPNEVILRLAASLKGASETEVLATLDRLNIKSQEATKVISLLANQTDLVRGKQALAATEYQKGTSLLDEFAKKNTNAAAEVAKAEKSFAQYRQELGEQLLPVYLQVLQATGLVLNVLRALPGFVGENKTAFGLLTLALLAFNGEQVRAQLGSLKTLALQKLVALGVLTEVEGKYSLITANGLLTAAQEGLNAAMAANPIGFVLTLVALLLFGLKQLYDRSESFRAAVGSLWKMLTPLGDLFKSLFAQLEPLAVQLGKLFGSIGGGKQVLETFGVVMGVSVVLPLKLFVANLQLCVDSLLALWQVGKMVANYFGADFTIDTTVFDKFGQHLKENSKSIASTLLGQDQQVEQGRDAARQQRIAAYNKRVADFLARHKQAEEARAKVTAAAQQASDLETLKARQASIKAALALVAAGSAEELRLKKLEITTKRDIDLLGEKKTEGDKKVIRAEALRDLRQLQDEYDKKQQDAAAKRAKEQADVEKKISDLKAGLLKDESERRILELTAAAEKEKATAKGTAEQIAEQRRLIEQKLAVDVAAERKKQADKEFEEAQDVERRKAALLVNEFDRRAAELRLAAASESRKVLDTDSQAAEKRRLIQEKLQHDLVALEQERVAKQAEIAAAIAAVDESIALSRIERRRQQSNEWSRERAQADADELAVRKEQLFDQYQQEYFQQGLNNEQKLALIRKYQQDRENLESEYDDRRREREKAGVEFGLGLAATALQTVADFEKIDSDKKLTKLEKEKKERLAKLDAEYKSGTLSKELYESRKASIEQNYDAKTREVKKQAAEKEKQFNIAQAIIAGALSVIKASPNVPLMVAAGVTAAAGVAKIIATPIPEFEQGGIFGRAWRGVKGAARSAAHYASGGRINARAGVADVGQRHSGGGIQMIDGATGQHLGEWERGEPYMILSRQTYANNRHLIDELIDTSLYRGGAPVRPRPGYYEDGGTFGGALPAGTQGGGEGQQFMQALQRVEVAALETRDAVRALPSRQYIGWEAEDTANVEERLQEREADRSRGSVS